MATSPLSSAIDFSKANQAIAGPYNPPGQIPLPNDGMDATAPDPIANYQTTLDNLEKLYAQGNGYKVAAGFLKPQLGGFSASLGSAMDAAGDNLNQQKEAALPIAQMRAQLGMQQRVVNNNQTAAKAIANWPAGTPYTPDFANYIQNIAPDSPQAKMVAGSQDLYTKTRQNQLSAFQAAETAYGNQVTVWKQQGGTGSPPTPPNPNDYGVTDVMHPTAISGNTKGTSATVQVPGAEGIAQSSVNGAPSTDDGSKSSIIPSLRTEDAPTNAKMVDEANARYAPIEAMGTPDAYNKFVQPVNTLLNLIQKTDPKTGKVSIDPDMQTIMGVMNKGGLMGAIMAGANSGVNVSAMGLNGSVALPVEKMLQAGIPKELIPKAQILAQGLAQLKLSDQAMARINPTASNLELGLSGAASASMATSPIALEELLTKKKIALDQYQDQYKFVHGIIQKNPGSPTLADPRMQMADILGSNQFNQIAGKYGKTYQAVDQHYHPQSTASSPIQNPVAQDNASQNTPSNNSGFSLSAIQAEKQRRAKLAGGN